MSKKTLGLTAFLFLLLLEAMRHGPARADDALRVGLQQEPSTLNPVIGTLAVETDAANLLFDGLFRYDEHGKLVPDLTTRVPTQRNGDISRDGLTITYHLVHNARWSDGNPVTSDDVKFTYDAIMNDANNVVSRLPYDHFVRRQTREPPSYQCGHRCADGGRPDSRGH